MCMIYLVLYVGLGFVLVLVMPLVMAQREVDGDSYALAAVMYLLWPLVAVLLFAHWLGGAMRQLSGGQNVKD